MTNKNTTLSAGTILEDIKRIYKDKGSFCSEEEFRYWFLSKNSAKPKGNYSLEYPFIYKKVHNAEIIENNAKVDAILWSSKKSKHGLYAFEFKYAHTDFIDKHDKHGRNITGSSPTIDIRYDFLEDIDRLESLFDDNDIDIDVGYAIFLTDIEAYRTIVRDSTVGKPLRIIEGAEFESGKEIKADGEGTDQYYKPMIFRSTYTITWNQIDGTKFYCCIVEVKPKDK